MILYFANRSFDILGMADNALPKGMKIVDDKLTQEIGTGGDVFECVISTRELGYKQGSSFAETGNYILTNDGKSTGFYTIIDTEFSTKTDEITIYAESEGLNLLNSIVGPYASTEAHPIEFYINLFAKDTGFEIGLNEVSTYSRKLSWEGQNSGTERLLSVAKRFDAEISFRFDIDKLKVRHKYIDIHRKVGRKTEYKLYSGKDVDDIRVGKNIENLATALKVTGGTPEESENPVTLVGMTYDDGDFYLDNGVLKSRSALSRWSRKLWEQTSGDGHIIQEYNYDTTSQKELLNRSISKLMKISKIEENYEIELINNDIDLKIGDVVYVIDEKRNIYLSGRVLRLENSDTNQERKATFGEYLVEENDISAKIYDLVGKLENYKPPQNRYVWIAYADDDKGTGITLNPTGKAYMGIAGNQLVKEVDISDPSIFTWSYVLAKDGEQGPPGEQGLPGKDGEQGLPGKDATITSKTPPVDKTQLWNDVSGPTPVLKRWNGTEWVKVSDDDQMLELYEQITSDIDKSGDTIRTYIAKEIYTKGDVNELNNKISTEITQNYNKIQFDFKTVNGLIDELSGSTDKRFEETKKYIRFIDGSIIIGIEGNPLILKLQNNRISFLNNENEIAYVSDNNIYIKNAEILNTIKITDKGETSTWITEKGMAIKNNGEDVLTATPTGVDAKNVNVNTYLIIGKNSRFEDYGADRTGCFWIGR